MGLQYICFLFLRYIKKTFQRAYAHVSPDIVIFLGDLLDEGSNANPEEYDSYVQRFRKVFIIPSNVKVSCFGCCRVDKFVHGTRT